MSSSTPSTPLVLAASIAGISAPKPSPPQTLVWGHISRYKISKRFSIKFWPWKFNFSMSPSVRRSFGRSVGRAYLPKGAESYTSMHLLYSMSLQMQLGRTRALAEFNHSWPHISQSRLLRTISHPILKSSRQLGNLHINNQAKLSKDQACECDYAV